MNTENIAHYFYGSAPAEDELMNAVFSGENTVDALKTAANQHEFLYTEKIRLWNELHMALVGCPGTEPISHEPLSQAIVGVDFVDDGQVAYTLLEDLDDIVSALNEVDEDAFLDKYLQQNGVENRDAALAEFRTLRDFYNKCQDFHGDDDYITDEEYLAQLETKREEITHEILERCRTKRKNLYITGPVALNVAQKFSVHRLCDKEGKHNLANRFVGELMEQLVQDGLLVTTKTRNGPGVRTATDAEISSPLPGQQQMTL